MWGNTCLLFNCGFHHYWGIPDALQLLICYEFNFYQFIEILYLIDTTKAFFFHKDTGNMLSNQSELQSKINLLDWFYSVIHTYTSCINFKLYGN